MRRTNENTTYLSYLLSKNYFIKYKNNKSSQIRVRQNVDFPFDVITPTGNEVILMNYFITMTGKSVQEVTLLN